MLNGSRYSLPYARPQQLGGRAASKHAAEQKKIMTGVSAPGSFAGQANPSTRANLLLQLPEHSISSCGGRPRLAR
jgi:hypothetical protein